MIAFIFSIFFASGLSCERNEGGREVTRAKKFMSNFMRGHGRVPFRPMPRRGLVVVAGDVFVTEVVATTSVSVIVLVELIDSVSRTEPVEAGKDIDSFLD